MKKYLLAIESAASESSVAILEVKNRIDNADTDKIGIEIGQHWLSVNQSTSLDHAEQLLPMIDALLLEAGISKSELLAVAFSQGPGAFTGLRIACGLAQGIALGLDLPLIPIDSLRATAQQAFDHLVETNQLQCLIIEHQKKKKTVCVDYIVTLLDARMGEAYMAIYQPIYLKNSADEQNINLQIVQNPCLINIKDVLLWLDEQRLYDDKHLYFCGNALDVYADDLAESFEVKDFDFTVLPGQVTEWANALIIARLAFDKWHKGYVIEPHLAAPIYLREKVAFTEKERAAGLSGNPSAEKPVVTKVDSASEQSVHAFAEPRSFQVGHAHYVLRPMVEADISGALLIEQTVQDYPWTRGNFKDSLRSNYPAWVVELESDDDVEQSSSRIVGFAVQMLAPDVAHVLLIAVEPSLQGDGFGTLLLKTLEKNALANGLDKQLLEVRESNDQAQRFYLRHRYAVIGKRKGYYREVGGASEDAIVLEKQLTADDANIECTPHCASGSKVAH